ncbi:MAG TPA: hypothetical protein VEP89_17250, partial [Draconibacterium sp.]|nr:hypothetical protein [Draconibacterium sp.]
MKLKNISILLLFSTCIFISACTNTQSKQEEAAGPVPASTNTQGIKFPKINPDLSVIFHVNAPEAKTVQVELGKRYDMTK